MSSPDDRDPWLERRQANSALLQQKGVKFMAVNGEAESIPADWPDPIDLLGQSIEAAAPFPVDFLPGALQDLAGDAADRMQCPVDFIGTPLIIAAATLIGKDFRLAPKAADDWFGARLSLGWPHLWAGHPQVAGLRHSACPDSQVSGRVSRGIQDGNRRTCGQN
jgi:hypothetical protein